MGSGDLKAVTWMTLKFLYSVLLVLRRGGLTYTSYCTASLTRSVTSGVTVTQTVTVTVTGTKRYQKSFIQWMGCI